MLQGKIPSVFRLVWRASPGLLALLLMGGPPVLAAGPAKSAVLSPAEERQAIERLPEKYRVWLAEVEHLITHEERAVFLALTRDYQRDAFIERFWEVRDKQRKDLHHEFRDQQVALVQEARTRFGDLRNDRSRILLKNGEPDEVLEAECGNLLWPLEAWHYEHGSELRGFEFWVVFFRRWNTGPFMIWDAPLHGLQALAADYGAGGERRINLGQVRLACRNGDTLVKALAWVLYQGDSYALQIAAFDGRPKPPGNEWVATFGAYTTDLPEGSALLPGQLDVSFPGRRESRTVVEGVLRVPAAAATLLHLGEYRSYDFLLTGEVVAQGALLESFRYKFAFPVAARGPHATTGDAAAAEVLPLVFQRALRPGDYTLVVKLEDLNSGKLLRIERPLEVPLVAAALPARTPAGPEVERVLDLANVALASGETTIKIVSPLGEPQTGMTRFDALTTGRGVARVTFALDGKAVLTKNRPPYSVELDLGKTPRIHRLTATAYDATGAVAAGDELVVNSAGHRFRIHLLEPRRGKRYERSLLARAEVEAPEGEGEVERVELYVGETLAATLYQPPYEQPLLLPPGQPASYVRAVAYLGDGSSTEDIAFINAPGELEQVDVQFVELYAAALDRLGRPVAGLRREDFTVFEDGVRQDLVRCERVHDLPIHAAILLDTSGSMESSLETARDAVLRFLQTAIKPRDRAAVITFNDHPYLAVKFSSDATALASSLAGLKAERGTALYDSVVYALYYFNGIKGQRAILLVSDGRDEGSRLTWEEALEAARHAGVTLYAIGLGDRIDRGKLGRLSADTGGRAFFIKSAAELQGIYATIEEELRSKYLLAYQSKNTSGEAAFRTIEVKSAKPGCEIKTLRGYYP